MLPFKAMINFSSVTLGFCRIIKLLERLIVFEIEIKKLVIGKVNSFVVFILNFHYRKYVSICEISGRTSLRDTTLR
jgi:hypothetical protein